MMRVPVLRDDDDGQGRREVDQKERALVHDDGGNRVRVMYGGLLPLALVFALARGPSLKGTTY